MAITYGDAGVNISEGNRAVTLLKPLVRSTMRKEVLTDIGSFAGLFALDIKKYKEPVLVSGTDGVGTKLKIAMMAGKHDTIGIDAVAMCVNDILVQGAEPLFFLDYIAIGKLVPEKVADIVRGVSDGCIKAGCALIGGETAEMPGLYDIDEYDIAGFAVGVVDRDMLIDGGSIASGDIVIGIPSTGLHSNGFSLVRKLVCDEARIDINQYSERLGDTYADVLLTPTRIYVKELLPLAQKGLIKGMAHITGGGLTENIPRILPADLSVSLNPFSWAIPPIFTLLQEIGSIPDEEMRRVFNMGIGMVIIVSPEKTSAVIDFIPDALIIGKVVDGDSGVIYK